MQLFILRHGHAEPQADRDSLRPLSAEGREEVATNVARYQSELAGIDRVVVSPLVRAQQTFEIAAPYLVKPRITVSDLLKPGGNPQAVIDYLYDLEQSGVKSVLLISHMPLVGSVIDSLCASETGRYRMSTASLASLQSAPMAAGGATLNWLHHARS